MTLIEFNGQTLASRSEEVWTWGFLVSKRQSWDLTTALYLVHGFFAVVIIRISDNKILNVKGLYNEDVLLDPTFVLDRTSPLLRAILPGTPLHALCEAA